MLLLAGIAYQAVGQARDRRRYRPPGKLLPLQNRKPPHSEQGTGEPAVLLEAGIAGTLLGWARVEPPVAEVRHVLSYDRAGLGWSGRLVMPRSLATIIDDMAHLQQEPNWGIRDRTGRPLFRRPARSRLRPSLSKSRSGARPGRPRRRRELGARQRSRSQTSRDRSELVAPRRIARAHWGRPHGPRLARKWRPETARPDRKDRSRPRRLHDDTTDRRSSATPARLCPAIR